MKTNKDTDLREALRRRYANTPSLPTDFTERLRERMDTKPAASHRRHWWGWMSAAAACLLIAIGVGVYYEFNKAPHSIAKLSAPDNKTECTQLSNRGAPIRQSGRTNQAIGAHRLSNRGAPTKPSGRTNRAIGAHQSSNRARSTEISDTLGNGIWRSERNVAIAIQMLSECEETILREEQEMRNHIIQATFNATPQPANVVLVTNEAGDYEVIETKTIIEI
ncbi:MAG: hypothetical protein K6A93_07430 [Bacteroidaceae bacterium]|nr:hypothetical protein [Bacteroidaceae bacterium]